MSSGILNPLKSRSNYSATSNNMKLVQRGGNWAGPSPPRPLLAVPNVTAHPSTASVPITILLQNGLLLCCFNVPIKGSLTHSLTHSRVWTYPEIMWHFSGADKQFWTNDLPDVIDNKYGLQQQSNQVYHMWVHHHNYRATAALWKRQHKTQNTKPN